MRDEVRVLKKKYAIAEKSGKKIRVGFYSEPEVRMAAKAGLRIFELDESGSRASMEITQELTGLFGGMNKEEPGDGG
jgi:hypothetical protein